MRWQILQMTWKQISSWNSDPYAALLRNPPIIAFFITADSFSPFHCIHECNLHNTISQQPYAFHSAEWGLQLFIFIFSLGLTWKTESMSQPADWKHLISMQGRYWGRLSLCDSSQSTPLIIMAQGRESAKEMEKSEIKKNYCLFKLIYIYISV